MRARQEQSAGDDSTLIQSNRDTIIHQHGVTAGQAMEIAQRVVISTLEHYQAEARQEVERRCSEIRDDLIRRIIKFDIDMLNSFKDPDVQALLMEAQESYARSGRDDVRRTLVDLVTARCRSEEGTLLSSAIEQGVAVVRKLSRASINALTLSFLIRRVHVGSVESLEALTQMVTVNWKPFIDVLPTSQGEYSHLIALGCIRTDILSVGIPDMMQRSYPGIFQRGVSADEIRDKFAGVPNAMDFFIPDPRNSTKLVIPAMSPEYARNLLPSTIRATHGDMYANHLVENHLTADMIEAELREIGEPWPEILDAWTDKYMRTSMYPTTVGVAIAHCNWTNLTNSDTPLSIWIN